MDNLHKGVALAFLLFSANCLADTYGCIGDARRIDKSVVIYRSGKKETINKHMVKLTGKSLNFTIDTEYHRGGINSSIPNASGNGVLYFLDLWGDATKNHIDIDKDPILTAFSASFPSYGEISVPYHLLSRHGSHVTMHLRVKSSSDSAYRDKEVNLIQTADYKFHGYCI